MSDYKSAKTPEEYIAALPDSQRPEIQEIYDFIRVCVPELEPHMRSGMIGFGTYHYKYDSGREGDWFKAGLARNKSYISVYASATNKDGYAAEQLDKKLGKVNTGRNCVRFKKFDDVNKEVLRELLEYCATAEF